MHKANRNHSAALLREMAAAGIPVDLSVAELDIQIELVGGVCDSTFFDLNDGRCGCIIDLLIINQTSRPIPIRDVELRPPWPNSEFDWLSDPKEAGRDPFIYRFPGRGAPELPRYGVINHVLLDRGILRPGHPVEGWLLGIGNPKPEKLFLGGPLDVTLSLIGHDCEYETRITLRVDPVWKRQQESRRKIARGGGLFTREHAENLGSPERAISARSTPRVREAKENRQRGS
jgi:hypothetical protein